jgi:hypothetical protein
MVAIRGGSYEPSTPEGSKTQEPRVEDPGKTGPHRRSHRRGVPQPVGRDDVRPLRGRTEQRVPRSRGLRPRGYRVCDTCGVACPGGPSSRGTNHPRATRDRECKARAGPRTPRGTAMKQDRDEVVAGGWSCPRLRFAADRITGHRRQWREFGRPRGRIVGRTLHDVGIDIGPARERCRSLRARTLRYNEAT